MGDIGDKWFGIDPPPDPPELPTTTVDSSGQEQYSKLKTKNKKGRRSTILTGLGSQNQNKKTVLG